MKIRCKSREEANNVCYLILSYIRRSRFTLSSSAGYGRPGGIWTVRVGKRWFVKIAGIRLREAKDNCGNHAGPCRLTWKKHQKRNFLEGLDWVSFDDMLNDALDSISHDGDVSSTVCIIRKGRLRRVAYYGVDGGEFFKDSDDFEDWCGKQAPRSKYQPGTPGIFGWEAETVSV